MDIKVKKIMIATDLVGQLVEMGNSSSAKLPQGSRVPVRAVAFIFACDVPCFWALVEYKEELITIPTDYLRPIRGPHV